ncbi:hypothetical protein GUITHDRAFT_137442 [Guillardia theta CCMP2712]|uniref:NADP-dependent glyceraldehyde-3-phosphate dehydrogenase n=2 Tax=Geminigeraceae TaxID=589343 RepID=L1JH90_GUITC|nr:hypothetical protein GUITHDRAFT_137442 [Guillardia theta CCMP2712]EKX47697.1 hypothetical protein GUITHDRAFT_137442 [Guillardia theta CCMP2712]|eukprot:XP_005834677.1 hypothetical protein GUITHDRAFT_137442 [Guillardia theta CCMP2712]
MIRLRVDLPLLLMSLLTLPLCNALSEGEACGTIPRLAAMEAESNKFLLYINGKFKPSSSGKTLQVLCPVNDSAVYEVQACTKEEIDEAFEAAKNAQKLWSKTPLWKRAELLKKAAAVLRENAAAIAEVMMYEVAKPLKAAISEVMRTADLFEYTAEEGVRVAGELLLSDAFTGEKRNKLALVQRVPLGVIVAIPPYNYPLNLAGSKVGPALMAGNSVVMKPPSAGAVTEGKERAGRQLGKGELKRGCRGSEVGDYLTQHRLANAVSFTGGSTGIRVAKGAGMIPMQLELGGKDPAIVLPDANLKAAASAIVKGAFSYSGQRCTAVKIVYIVEEEDEISRVLLPMILELVKKLKVGGPEEEDVDITAVIDGKSASYIKSLVDDALELGAKLQLPEGGWKQEGNLIHPVVLTGVKKSMRIVYEEQFGPVLPIVSVKTAEEAVELANGSPLGLQASLFTQVNGAPARGPDHFPFQGFKDSGLSSQGVRWSIEAMTKIKSTVLNLAQESYTQG